MNKYELHGLLHELYKSLKGYEGELLAKSYEGKGTPAHKMDQREDGYEEGYCNGCGDCASTHPDASKNAHACGDCNKVVCNECHDGTSATRCPPCARKFKKSEDLAKASKMNTSHHDVYKEATNAMRAGAKKAEDHAPLMEIARKHADNLIQSAHTHSDIHKDMHKNLAEANKKLGKTATGSQKLYHQAMAVAHGELAGSKVEKSEDLAKKSEDDITKGEGKTLSGGTRVSKKLHSAAEKLRDSWDSGDLTAHHEAQKEIAGHADDHVLGAGDHARSSRRHWDLAMKAGPGGSDSRSRGNTADYWAHSALSAAHARAAGKK